MASLDVILGNEGYFSGIELPLVYEIKNPDKYIGKEIWVHYNKHEELNVLREMDNNPDILQWCYHGIGVPFEHPISKEEELFVPSFYVLSNKPTDLYSPDSPHEEFLIQVISEYENEYTMQLDLLDEEDYTNLTDEEKEMYDFKMDATSYQILKFKAADEYCKKNGMRFSVVSNEGEMSLSSTPSSKIN